MKTIKTQGYREAGQKKIRDLTRTLDEEGILEQRNIFALNKLIDVKKINNSILQLLRYYSGLEEEEIEEIIWEERRIIAKAKNSAKKLARCILCDLSIEATQLPIEKKRRLKLITTLVISKS